MRGAPDDARNNFARYAQWETAKPGEEVINYLLRDTRRIVRPDFTMPRARFQRHFRGGHGNYWYLYDNLTARAQNVTLARLDFALLLIIL